MDVDLSMDIDAKKPVDMDTDANYHTHGTAGYMAARMWFNSIKVEL